MIDSRYAPSTSANNNISVSNGEQNSTSSSSQSSSSFSGIANEEALASLLAFIKKGGSGGSEAVKNSATTAKGQQEAISKLLEDYSKGSAFSDAAQLMAQNLQSSMQSNMPAISKAIQGAGTSANSMQGLLSQNLATASAQAAGALGAQQAVSYGQIQSSLSNTLKELSALDLSKESNWLKAIELLKVSQSQSSSVSNNVSSGTQQSYQGPANLQASSIAANTNTGNGQTLVLGGGGPLVDPSGYQYIPYNFQDPSFVNPYSSANYSGDYSWG